jgi:hypothetical protein
MVADPGGRQTKVGAEGVVVDRRAVTNLMNLSPLLCEVTTNTWVN